MQPTVALKATAPSHLRIDQVLVDSRWAGRYGIGRFATEVLKAWPTVMHFAPGLAPHPFHKLDPLWTVLQILTRRPRLYFSLGFNPPFWSPTPFVFTLYDLILLRFPQEASRLMQPYFKYIVRPAVRRAKFVLTCSEYSKQEIMAWAKVPSEKVKVVGCGVDERFCPEGDRYNPGFSYLLYVGNHQPHKNLPRLLKAFAQAQIPMDLKLLLSGNPNPELMPLIEELKLVDRVEFTGFIDDKALPSYYRGAKALLFPSLYEGFGLPPLEAMACGIPVLTSNVTSLPEVVGEAALLVDPHQIISIAQGIESIVLQRDLRNRLIARGIIQAKHHQWSQTIAKTEAVLLQCLKGL
jgi:glycosyltransferase involved in cell wall biosynthesis